MRLRDLSRGSRRGYGTVLVRRLLNDEMRAVAALEEIDADRRVRRLFGIKLFQFCAQGVGPVSDSRVFGSRVILGAPERFYSHPILGNLLAPALNLHRADVPQECPELFGAHKRAALKDQLQSALLVKVGHVDKRIEHGLDRFYLIRVSSRNSKETVGQDCILRPIFNRPLTPGQPAQIAPIQSARRIQSRPTVSDTAYFLIRR